MTAVGWVGLGKLGLPCALTLAYKGSHQVLGYDPSPWPWAVLDNQAAAPTEEGLEELLTLHRSGNHRGYLRKASSIDDLVFASQMVFVAVQTPHAPEYGGEEPAPADRRDFDYHALVQAVRSVCHAAERLQRKITLVVVSTVLPGTTNRLLRPLLNNWVDLVYNPFFIAMGTTVADFCRPEMVLLGADRDDGPAARVLAVYNTLHQAPPVVVSIESAELAKVSYNTFISLKITWANALMELAHKTGADCDEVVDVLEHATDRVISSKYMRGGMGDGGHCHPRDLIAMSWLAQRVGMSHDLIGELVTAREQQSGWLADLVQEQQELAQLNVRILGKAYKPGSPLTGGSPALLLWHQLLSERQVFADIWDPYVDGGQVAEWLDRPRVYVIATRHPEFAEAKYPAGSVVIDPWGCVPDQEGVTVIRIGRKT